VHESVAGTFRKWLPWPTTWNEFLPISMPITAIAVLDVLRHGVLLVFGAPCQLRLLAGQEHGRTIPLADLGNPRRHQHDTPAERRRAHNSRSSSTLTAAGVI